MAYTLSVDINLGAGNTGLTLTPALFDSANSAAAGLTTSTMVEVAAGSGSYLWTGTIPDAHRGYISFSSGATFKTKVGINAQEVENPDLKTSTRSSHTAADVWASGTRTLTSFGTLVADIWANVTRTLTSAAAPSAAVVAAAVWDEPRSSHLQLGSFGIADQVVTDGQAQAGSSTTLTLNAGASAVNDFYKNDVIFLKVGTGAGQVNIISGYVGATKIATVLSPWVVTPDATSCFVILPLALIPGASNVSAADIWAYVPRTLTQTAAEIAAVLSGSTITVPRGDTATFSLTDLGNISTRTRLYFTVKKQLDDADTAAILQVEESDGLLFVNGEAATAGDGSLVVDDATTGDITVTFAAGVMADLSASQNYRYDVQRIAGADVLTLTAGTFTVSALSDVTRAIT